jgi:hypothetical protein
MSHDMCTFQLHVMNCRMPSQEAASGRVCFNTEYWVEREVQYWFSTSGLSACSGAESKRIQSWC